MTNILTKLITATTIYHVKPLLIYAISNTSRKTYAHTQTDNIINEITPICNHKGIIILYDDIPSTNVVSDSNIYTAKFLLKLNQKQDLGNPARKNIIK